MRGELKLAASRVGDDAIAPGLAVRAELAGGASRALVTRAVRRRQGRPLVAFEGIDDADAAQALVGATLWLDRDAVALDQDEYFDADLIGCALVTATGERLGTVAAVEHYPAQDMLIVARRAGGRAMVPLIRAFIRRVDVAEKRIEVDVPPGLIDAAEADEA